MTKEIAEQLLLRRMYNEKYGRKAGFGCPFSGRPCLPCNKLFPSRDWDKTDRCPCLTLNRTYVVRKAHRFMKDNL